MLIRTAKASDILSSEITPHSVFLRRRQCLRAAAFTFAAIGIGPYSLACRAEAEQKLSGIVKTKWNEARAAFEVTFTN